MKKTVIYHLIVPYVAVTLTSLYSDSVFLYLEHFLTLYGIVMDRSY